MDHLLRYKWLRLAYLCVALIIVNILVIYFFDINVSRVFRWVSTFIFLAFFFHHDGYTDKMAFLIMLLFLIRDGCIINYENEFFRTASFFVTNAAYFLLILLNAYKTKLISYNPIIVVFALVMIGLNGFNLYYLSDVIIAGLDNTIQFYLFFLQGMLLIILGLVAFTYNDRFDGNTSLQFLYFSFCLILCDLSGLAAYFFKWQIAYYPERIFYLMSLAMFLNFAFNNQVSERESPLFMKK